ncbi:nucleotidyltransferase domain-containing protein [Pelagibius sp.]|uniref:nucleotidyltransferase domain-containing protein n=1 Tax=Pelagibius sp. TaxID=1931238 RepID=UPI003B511905
MGRQDGEGMTAEDVTAFCAAMAARGIGIWLDGGWGVDALLGRQTRAHSDLDIVVEEKDLQDVVGFLQGSGYRDLPRPDTRPWNFALGDQTGRIVDLHVVVLDDRGNGRYGPPEAGEGCYPAEALEGRGEVNGRAVRCTSAAFQVQSHSGYALTDKDHRDVTALAEAFDLELPAAFRDRPR